MRETGLPCLLYRTVTKWKIRIKSVIIFSLP